MYKFYVSGKLDPHQAEKIKKRMREKLGFSRIIVTAKDNTIVIDVKDDYMLSGVVEEINNCGLEVDGYVEIK